MRGEAVNSAKLIKAVHNTFARKMDMLKADMGMKEESDKWTKKKNRLAKLEAAKEAARAAGKPTPEIKSKSRGKGKAKASDDADFDLNDGSEDDELPVYHYVAFVPIKGELWRLDGMDKNPVNLGEIKTSNWLLNTIENIQTQMQQQQGLEYSLLALVKDPVTIKREELALNIRMLRLAEQRLDAAFKDWREGYKVPTGGVFVTASTLFGVTEEMLDAVVMPEERLKKTISDNNARTLVEWRNREYELQKILQTEVIALEKSCDEDYRKDWEKAEERRHEFGEYIYWHLRKLAERGELEQIVKEVQEEKKRKERM